MRRLTPLVLPALAAALLVVAGGGGADDLTVAVAEDVRGARIDSAPGAPEDPVTPVEDAPAVEPGEVEAAAGEPGAIDAGAVDVAPAVTDDGAATGPAGEVPTDSGPDDPVVPPPLDDGTDVDTPAPDAGADETELPALPLGDVPTASDEVTPPAVEDTPIPADEDDSLDLPIPDEDDWKPEPPKPPVFKDGEWNTSFDYLGSFDTGIDAIDPGSALAQHTPKMPEQEGAPEPEKGIPDAVRKMDGQKVRIEGYMIPLKFEDGAVKTFFLSRYMMGCCFGVLPKANEVIEVQMTGDKGAYYDAYMPFIVVGTFEIVEEGTSPEFLQSVFRIKADSCDYAEDW